MVRPPYQRAWALSQVAILSWEDISGEAFYHGVNLKELKIVDLFSAVNYWIFRNLDGDAKAEQESRVQSMLAPDLYAWRGLLPAKTRKGTGKGPSRKEFLAQYEGLPGVNVG